MREKIDLLFFYMSPKTHIFSDQTCTSSSVHPVTKGTHLITRNGSEPTNHKRAKRCILSLALTVSIGLVLKSLEAFLLQRTNLKTIPSDETRSVCNWVYLCYYFLNFQSNIFIFLNNYHKH